ncbi:MAG TPA: alpha/beta hydrolase [Candidatus Cybelea sp.]|nr:alpha/beta hydrolase [Candidatus Cybelea sp.]
MSLAPLAALGALGAAGAGLAAWNHSLRAAAERSWPAEGRFVSVDGTRLHYLEYGNPAKQAVLLLHGANGTCRDWTHGVAQGLERDFHLLAFDRPGSGWSTRPRSVWPDPGVQAALLHDALQKLGVMRPILVGFSWAAAVAMAYALDHPDAAAGVLSVGGVLYSWRGSVNWLYRFAATPVLGPLLARAFIMPVGRPFARRWAYSAFAPDPIPPAFDGAAVELALRPDSFLATAEDIRRLSEFLSGQSRRYAELAMPLAILVGDGDGVVSPRLHSFRLHRELPEADLIVEKGAGHLLPYARPEAVVSAVRSLAARIEAR